MKYIRIGVVILFCISIITYGYSRYQGKRSVDPSLPIITSTIDRLEISCDYKEEDLLAGLSAEDELDGDLTDEIIVGNISRFQSDGTCKVTYVVFDSFNQSATLTRETVFTDYQSPKFVLNQPLVFTAGDVIDLSSCLGAKDMLDGDISSLARVSDDNVNYLSKGDYQLNAEVTNSFGDLTREALPVHIVEPNQLKLSISLKEPLIYLEKGASFNPRDYIETVSQNGTELDTKAVEAYSNVNTGNPGCYEVKYTAQKDGNTGVTWLTVIVR